MWESDVLHNSSMKPIIQHNTNKKLNMMHHIPVNFLSPFAILYEQKDRIFTWFVKYSKK